MNTRDGPSPPDAIHETNDESGSQLMLPLSRGMRRMRAAQASEMNDDAPEAADDDIAEVLPLHESAGVPLGRRLMAARESRGLSIADVSGRLKLPVKLIERLEGDDYTGMTDGVFLRGYLGSYARLVGVPVEQATSVAAAHTQTVPLVATGTISRSRYLFDRYSVSATYLVLTAIIVVPAVWLATHGGLEQNLARTTPLDPPAVTALAPEHDAPSSGHGATAAEDESPTRLPVDSGPNQPLQALPADPSPVIASMTPFSAAPAAVTLPVSAATESAVGGAHTLILKLSQQSWVEVTAADGRKLEYGMLAAGSEHTYRSDGQLSVRLGNVQGAQLHTDGTAVDLTPFQRGNVAHVRVFGEGGSPVSRIDQ